MPFIQLRVIAPRERCAAAEELLLDLGAISVTLEDTADQPIYEPGPGETPLWESVRVTGLFDAGVDTAALDRELETRPERGLRWRFEQLEDRDWVREWMRDYHPMRFGQRLWICPSWSEAPEPDAVNLALDPGLAFGTGTHPTTALCLRWLDGAALTDCRVLDYGCGSGVLAVAALLLGARDAIGVDIDAQALQASRDNARRNHIDDARLALRFPGELADEYRAGITLANILAGPLLKLAPTLARHTATDGMLVLSGLLDEQADAIVTRYREWFTLEAHETDGEWCALSLKRLANSTRRR